MISLIPYLNLLLTKWQREIMGNLKFINEIEILDILK